MSGLPLKRGAAVVAAYLLCFAPVHGALSQPLDQYFTNLAARLIVQQLGIRLDEVQIFPTNQYDAATHRVFQVAANICDAMNSNAFPLVFRPLFRTNNGVVFLSGFQQCNNRNTIGEWLESNPYRIPLVIAARKGFPNFNEFTTRTDTMVTRKLQLTRPTTNSLPARTNQMYILTLSNNVFVESWNSYATPFETPSRIEVTNVITITITNMGGVLFSNSVTVGSETNISSWERRIAQPGQGFSLPLMTAVFPASNLVYNVGDNRFAPFPTNQYEVVDGFPYPEWTLVVSNHLVYLHSVGTNLIDGVFLNDASVQQLTDLLSHAPSPPTLLGTSVWDTNRLFGPSGPTEGILAQIVESRTTGTAQEWVDFMPVVGDRNRAVTNFLKFLLGFPSVPLVVEAPFNPMARITQIKTYQANDPLVHSHARDLLAFPSNTVVRTLRRTEDVRASDNPASATNHNRAYRPWGATWLWITDSHALDVGLRDHGVCTSDEWDFPREQSASMAWLGRVHRGTPWQTIYLKGRVAPLSEWIRHAGSAANHPTNDWKLAAMLAGEWKTNDLDQRVSINSERFGDWSAVFDGLTVWTNMDVHPWISPRLDPYEIHAEDATIGIVVDGLKHARGRHAGGYFADVASFLGTIELSVGSPWLNLNVDPEVRIPDVAYEVLPLLLLERVRPDPVARICRVGEDFTVQFSGCIPGSYTVEGSSDLESWTPLPGVHIVTNDVFEVIVPGASVHRFFRTASSP